MERQPVTDNELWPLDPSYEPFGGERDLTHRDADWSGLSVLVVGLGVSGFAAADALLERGANVRVVSRDKTDVMAERAQILEVLGAEIAFGAEHMTSAPQGTQLVVTSPGVPPTDPLMTDAADRGIPVWGEVELAWRMRPREGAAPWITITGTNGKTTAVTMLESILQAQGLRAVAAGNVGMPIMEAILDPQPFDVIAVELSTFQLHWSRSVSPFASCLLNVAPDHVDWHGSFEEYRRQKGRVFERTQAACVYNVDDPTTEALLEEAEVVEGCRAIGFTLGTPAPSMVGIVEDVLADRAFVEERRTSAAELAVLRDLGPNAAAPHYVADALAAAALARSYGVSPAAVRKGLMDYSPQPHRMALVATLDGVRYVNDSKATNPPAAAASLTAYEPVVWIAGGLLKGADVSELVRDNATRLRGAVLMGRDRDAIARALAEHAPVVPVVIVEESEPEAAMTQALEHARGMAQSGDTVLLAPAAASLDMYASYGARGDAFTRIVESLGGADA